MYKTKQKQNNILPADTYCSCSISFIHCPCWGSKGPKKDRGREEWPWGADDRKEVRWYGIWWEAGPHRTTHTQTHKSRVRACGSLTVLDAENNVKVENISGCEIVRVRTGQEVISLWFPSLLLGSSVFLICSLVVFSLVSACYVHWLALCQTCQRVYAAVAVKKSEFLEPLLNVADARECVYCIPDVNKSVQLHYITLHYHCIKFLVGKLLTTHPANEDNISFHSLIFQTTC